MATFKNKNFITRNYECTSVIACTADVAPNDNYKLADEAVLEGLTHLYTESGVRYFGHL